METDRSWSDAQWVRILDRLEYRQPGIGLRFSGPPLWLEVTMTGPDADAWPSTDGPAAEWNWQSADCCTEATELAASGADDDRILAVVGRYTFRNLVLNAIHEIGEWLRLDGERLFPAHLPITGSGRSWPADGDGNGAVALGTVFDRPAEGEHHRRQSVSLDDQMLHRVGEAVAASRFTYLPGTSISYDPAGPVVSGPSGTWRSTWSPDLSERTGPGFVHAIGRDVHRAVVEHEADRVCSAFRVDGRPAWSIAAEPPARVGSLAMTLSYGS